MTISKIRNHPLAVESINSWKYPAYYLFGRTEIHGVLVKKQSLRSHEILRFIVTGEYEKEEVTLLSDILTNTDRLIEFGSGIGVTSIFSQKTMGLQGRILSFDGNHEAIRAAKVNANINDCHVIEYLHGAVTPTDEVSLAFRKDTQFWASNLTKNHTMETTAIPAFNLDKVLDNFRPTCGIMDIEGGEYDLLASNAWQSCGSLRWLVVEFHATNSSDGNRLKENKLIEKLNHLTQFWYFSIHPTELAKNLLSNPASAVLRPKLKD